MSGRLIVLKDRGRSLTHFLAPHIALLCQSGVLWEHTGEQSNSSLIKKIEETDKAELGDVFQVSRTAIPPLPIPLSLPAVWCLYFNPQRAKCST